MVKLYCGVCGSTFQAQASEMWICPNCEEAGNIIFNVLSITKNEIDELFEGLDRVKIPGSIPAEIRLKPPTEEEKRGGIYASFSQPSSMVEALYILPLLFERIYLKCMHTLSLNDENTYSLANDLVGTGIVVPVGDVYGLHFLDREKVKIIWPQDVMSYVPMNNLTTSLSYEDVRAMDDTTKQELKSKLKQLYGYKWDSPALEENSFYLALHVELVKYHTDLLLATKLNLPFTVEPSVQEIHQWEMMRVSKLFGNEIGKEISAVKRFLRSLSISIPVGLTFDEIASFRKQKASVDFRNELFSISRISSNSSSIDISQDLLAQFYHKITDFNEVADSYAEKRTLVLTGSVSTIAGLIGGPVGAIVGGLGASVASPVTKATFRWLFERGHKDWVCFFWKWHKAAGKESQKATKI